MKKKILVGALIVVVIGAIITGNVLKSKGSLPAFGGGKAFEVKVKKIENGDISATVPASGIIEEVEKSEVYFDSAFKVTGVLVEKNDKVSKGQKLLELDMDYLNSELEQAKISKRIQELALQKAWPSGLPTSAENSLAVAQNDYYEARKNYENSKRLFEAGAVSQTDLEKAEKLLKDAEIAVKNAQSGISGQSVDTLTLEQNLKQTLLKISDIEARIKKMDELAHSAIDGQISEVNVVKGGFTSIAQPAVKIVNPDKLRIKADVKEFSIKSIKVGQKVEIYGDAVDRIEGVEGKVASISPVAKKNKTTSGDETLVEVTVSVEKGNPVLKPGLSVTCDIITQTRNNVPIGTFEMLKDDKDGNKLVFVYDINSGTLKEARVSVGITSELSFEFAEGIRAGDQVVMNPQSALKDGARAKITTEDKE